MFLLSGVPPLQFISGHLRGCDQHIYIYIGSMSSCGQSSGWVGETLNSSTEVPRLTRYTMSTPPPPRTLYGTTHVLNSSFTSPCQRSYPLGGLRGGSQVDKYMSIQGQHLLARNWKNNIQTVSIGRWKVQDRVEAPLSCLHIRQGMSTCLHTCLHNGMTMTSQSTPGTSTRIWKAVHFECFPLTDRHTVQYLDTLCYNTKWPGTLRPRDE